MAELRTRPSRDRYILVAVVVLAVAVLGFLLARGGGETGASGEAGLEHVHGLGVDPADGTLYAGAHYGLFRLPEPGQATLVADRVQDFMGFTVAGPGHFLASGHPGEGQGGPSALGLIESTDAGRTWQTLSLSGEADFHALEYRHQRVYGVNALTGQFMVSDDMTSWEARTTLPMADFTVDPEDADTILATTEQGPALSRDGGATFALVRGAPLLLLVSWADDGSLVGISPDGTVYAAADEAATWRQRGTLPGSPEALVALNRDEVYAAAGGAVLVSTDGGRDFTVHYQE